MANFTLYTDTSYIGLLQYLNSVSNDLFTPLLLGVIFAAAIMSTRNQNFSASLVFSSSLCAILSLILLSVQAISVVFVSLFAVIWGLALLLTTKVGD